MDWLLDDRDLRDERVKRIIFQGCLSNYMQYQYHYHLNIRLV